ncbi:MAG: hypothetical protein DI537_10550 [Stutzerimonas stutzeri]|nr:MAG: hypothetical protein DI537_10550 [Stutzerimonas stutzeri]
MTQASDIVIKPGDGAKALELTIQRIGLALDAKSRRIKFDGVEDIAFLSTEDHSPANENDIILALPGDVVRVDLRYRFGRLIASDFRNLTMRLPANRIA